MRDLPANWVLYRAIGGVFRVDPKLRPRSKPPKARRFVSYDTESVLGGRFTNAMVDLLIETVHKIGTRSKRKVVSDIAKDIERVYGKERSRPHAADLQPRQSIRSLRSRSEQPDRFRAACCMKVGRPVDHIWVYPSVTAGSYICDMSQKGGIPANVTIHMASHPNVTDLP